MLYTVEGGSLARDVRHYSEFPTEHEVLMPFGSAVSVVTSTDVDHRMLLVTLRQTNEFVSGSSYGQPEHE